MAPRVYRLESQSPRRRKASRPPLSEQLRPERVVKWSRQAREYRRAYIRVRTPSPEHCTPRGVLGTSSASGMSSNSRPRIRSVEFSCSPKGRMALPVSPTTHLDDNVDSPVNVELPRTPSPTPSCRTVRSGDSNSSASISPCSEEPLKYTEGSNAIRDKPGTEFSLTLAAAEADLARALSQSLAKLDAALATPRNGNMLAVATPQAQPRTQQQEDHNAPSALGNVDDMCLSDLEELLGVDTEARSDPKSCSSHDVPTHRKSTGRRLCLLEGPWETPDGEVADLLRELATDADMFDPSDYWIDGDWDLESLREDAQEQRLEKPQPEGIQRVCAGDAYFSAESDSTLHARATTATARGRDTRRGCLIDHRHGANDQDVCCRDGPRIEESCLDVDGLSSCSFPRERRSPSPEYPVLGAARPINFDCTVTSAAPRKRLKLGRFARRNWIRANSTLGKNLRSMLGGVH